MQEDIRFPPYIDYGLTESIRFNTSVSSLQSGQEVRNINWQQGKSKFTFTVSMLPPDKALTLNSFFRSCRGRARAFRFRNWVDYKLEKGDVAIADGVKTVFQIIKIYKVGDYEEVKEIKKILTTEQAQEIAEGRGQLSPYIETELFFDDAPASSYTLDYNTGIITFDDPPPVGVNININCEFDFFCRFEDDELSVTYDYYNLLNYNSISLVEIKT